MAGPNEPSALIGTGVLRTTRGDVLLVGASYRLTVRSTGNGLLEPVEGTILNPPVPWGFPVTAIGADVVLEMPDGRRWECVLLDHRGRLTARGSRFSYLT